MPRHLQRELSVQLQPRHSPPSQLRGLFAACCWRARGRQTGWPLQLRLAQGLQLHLQEQPPPLALALALPLLWLQ